jgi:plasmid maintenance system killer protein
MIQSFRHKGLKKLFEKGEAKGDMKGLWAVTVRANWRVTFRFEEGEACNVDLVDYH